MQAMYSSKEGLIIKPHERREVILKYPTSVIMFHHPSYFKIADDLVKEMTSLVLDKNWKYSKRYRKKYSYKGYDLVLDNPGESARSTMKHAEAHYMWGARHIINIGACGGINPKLEIGDHIIGDRAIRDNHIDWELATSDEQAKSDKGVNDSINAAMIGNQLGNYKIERGDVWTVGHKYYQRQRLQHILNDEDYNLHCVEMVIYKYTSDLRFDGVGAMLTGLALAFFAYFILVGAKDLLIGRSASKAVIQKIMDAVMSFEQVTTIMDIRTLVIGTRKILINLEINVIDDLNTPELEKLIDRIEEEINKSVEITSFIQIELETEK